MKKMCVMLVIVIGLGLPGCKKSPAAKPEPTVQKQPATEQAAPATKETAAEAQKVVKETTEKATESAKPAAEQAKQQLITTAANIDLTSSIDTLKAQAEQMSVDALKATAEKYKTQLASTKSELDAKNDQLAKIPAADRRTSTEAMTLTKEIMTLTNSWASLRERMAVYVDALKAKGADTGSLKP